MTTRRQFINNSLGQSLKMLALASSLAPMLSQPARAALFGKIPEDMPEGKSVYRLQGDVFVDQQPATMDTFISAESFIETGNNSLIIFVVGEDAHILRENSQLQLSGEGVVERGLRLITGKLLSVFGEREADSGVTINTSTATIGIRGTGFYAESDADRSYLCTCYGDTQIQSNIDINASETISTTYHDSPRYVYRQPRNGQYIVSAPVINHTDEELMLIEALVGRDTPFGSFRGGYQLPRSRY